MNWIVASRVGKGTVPGKPSVGAPLVGHTLQRAPGMHKGESTHCWQGFQESQTQAGVMERLSIRRQQQQVGIPQLEANLQSLSLSWAGWSSAPSSSHTPEPTVTQPALDQQTCTFSTHMYFTKRCRSLVFLCTEMDRATSLSFTATQLQSGWPANGRKRVLALF